MILKRICRLHHAIGIGWITFGFMAFIPGVILKSKVSGPLDFIGLLAAFFIVPAILCFYVGCKEPQGYCILLILLINVMATVLGTLGAMFSGNLRHVLHSQCNATQNACVCTWGSDKYKYDVTCNKLKSAVKVANTMKLAYAILASFSGAAMLLECVYGIKKQGSEEDSSEASISRPEDQPGMEETEVLSGAETLSEPTTSWQETTQRDIYVDQPQGESIEMKGIEDRKPLV